MSLLSAWKPWKKEAMPADLLKRIAELERGDREIDIAGRVGIYDPSDDGSVDKVLSELRECHPDARAIILLPSNGRED